MDSSLPSPSSLTAALDASSEVLRPFFPSLLSSWMSLLLFRLLDLFINSAASESMTRSFDKNLAGTFLSRLLRLRAESTEITSFFVSCEAVITSSLTEDTPVSSTKTSSAIPSSIAIASSEDNPWPTTDPLLLFVEWEADE